MLSKYRAKRTEVDGIVFASKREAARYQELKLLERAGRITDLQLQVRYELQPAFIFKNRKMRRIDYIADFVYMKNGSQVVEDVKGVKTDVYKLKKKLMAYKYKIDVEEV